MIPTSLPGLVIFPFRLVILFGLRLTDRTRWGPAFVASARDFRLLARRLHDRFELNLEVTLAASAYLVRTTDFWWKDAIQLFMTSADVIVLDISQVTQGTSWEIEAISRLGLWDRVVMVANSERMAAAGSALDDLAARPGSASAPDIAHVYAPSGLIVDREAFRADMFSALRQSVTARARVAA
jgi:hypothetical protein